MATKRPLPEPIESGTMPWQSYDPTTYVYRVYDDEDTLLYVGMAGNLKHRLARHVGTSAPWLPWAHRVEWERFEIRLDAERVEQHYILTLVPLFNITYNSNGHAIPHLSTVRR